MKITNITILLTLLSTRAETFILSTSNSIPPSRAAAGANQGWWSDSIPNTPANANYLTDDEHRAFFIFDLSLPEPAPGHDLLSATLRIQNPSSSFSTPGAVLQIWDTSTSASALNAMGAPNAAIFNDLGSGTLYGSVAAPISSDTVVEISLNSSALSAIAGHIGLGYWAIGAAIANEAESNVLFSGSGAGGEQTLTLLFSGGGGTTTFPISSVPEPREYALMFGAGLIAFGLFRKYRARLIPAVP